MKCAEVMQVLSQCELGAVLMEKNTRILALNEMADRLLHGDGKLVGQLLWDVAAPLCEVTERPVYANIFFREYLLRCPSPEVSDLPHHSELVVFRNAENDACHDMLISVLNQISESVVLCDAQGRMYLLNDAAVKMDSIVTFDVLGDNVSDVYHTRDGSELLIPQVIRDRRPRINHRQYYTTKYGKDLDVVSNNYPIIQNGQILGGFAVMEDWSQINDLNRQILDLHDRLLERTAERKSREKSLLSAKYQFKDIIHISSNMNSVLIQCKRVAKSDSSVMIYGETGTGKELLAQSIHNASSRANDPFLAINCAAIPENLLEGILFGTEKGAYTGAERRAGLFEQADNGTLLLDEINSMQISLQSKLLRVLQDGMIRRVGSTSEIHVNVRVLSNINLPPYQAIEEGKLRRDLFYRLGVVNINIPPLRERKEDISLLAKSFILQCNKKLIKNISNIDNAVLSLFHSYDWPGNVRELQHAIEHAMNILPDNCSVITPEYLPTHISASVTPAVVQPEMKKEYHHLSRTVQDIEYRALCDTLRANKGNVTKAAADLGMSRQNLQYRIKRFGIDIQAIKREQL